MDLFVMETEKPEKGKAHEVLDLYRRSTKDSLEIEPGMAPNEVADIVSDAMITMLRRDLRVDEWPEIIGHYQVAESL